MKYSILLKTAFAIGTALIVMGFLLGCFIYSNQISTIEKIQSNQKSYIIQQLDRTADSRILENHKHIKKLSTSISGALQSSLQNYDRQMAKKVIRKFLGANEIKAIRLFDLSLNENFLTAIKKDDGTHEFLKNKIPEEYKKLENIKLNLYLNSDEKLGFYEVYYDISLIYDEIEWLKKQDIELFEKQIEETKNDIHKMFLKLVIGSITGIVLIIVLIVFVLNHLVKRPLDIFQKGLFSFFSFLQDSSKKVEPIVIPSNDEFGSMGRKVNENIQVSIELHNELEKFKENLEDIVKERTNELENAKKEIECVKNDIEQILSNIMLPILITSKKDRKIVYANKYSQQQYKMSLDELVGSDIDIVYSDNDQRHHILHKMQKDGKVENIEEQFKRSDGEIFTGLLSVSPIQYRGEDAFIGMVVDITKQKSIEEEMRAINKRTRESIEYASLIQGSLIPDNELFRKYFKEYFVMWHPKDIVGGDIYLFEELRTEDECLLMVIDCTGHGVPGAFVTMLVKAIERQITSRIMHDQNEIVSPAKILKIFNGSMKHLLKQHCGESISNAGFDGQVVYYNKQQKILKCASARNEIFYLQEGEVKTIKGDRHSVGYRDSDPNYEFKEHIIDVSTPTSIYLSSDGLIDQLGGEKELPFGKRRLKRIIDEMRDESMAEQQEEFIYELHDYQGDMERQDDITFIGIKI